MSRFILAIFGVVLGLTFTGASVFAEEGFAPSGLTAVINEQGGTVDLAWTPGTDPDYIGQWLVVQQVGNPLSIHGLGHFGTDSEAYGYLLINMEPGKDYTFQIAGMVEFSDDNPFGQKGFSNIVTVTAPSTTTTEVGGTKDRPEPVPVSTNPRPQGLSATASSGSVTLSWTPGADSSYTGQEVIRRTAGVKGWTTLATIGASETGYTDSSVTARTKYIYRIKAVRDDGSGRISKPDSVRAR